MPFDEPNLGKLCASAGASTSELGSGGNADDTRSKSWAFGIFFLSGLRACLFSLTVRGLSLLLELTVVISDVFAVANCIGDATAVAIVVVIVVDEDANDVDGAFADCADWFTSELNNLYENVFVKDCW